MKRLFVRQGPKFELFVNLVTMIDFPKHDFVQKIQHIIAFSYCNFRS